LEKEKVEEKKTEKKKRENKYNSPLSPSLERKTPLLL